MPIGADAVMPIRVRITVSGRPPQRSVPIGSRPNTPPAISAKKSAKATTQPTASARAPRRVHSIGSALATSVASTAPVASAGRHCCSYG